MIRTILAVLALSTLPAHADVRYYPDGSARAPVDMRGTWPGEEAKEFLGYIRGCHEYRYMCILGPSEAKEFLDAIEIISGSKRVDTFHPTPSAIQSELGEDAL